jgi:2',3'-cyclic-nucleotide 2'-phosphodiesterase
MNILCIGDVVGEPGRDLLKQLLPGLRAEFSLDLIVVNAENAAGGSGLTPRLGDQLFQYGCDVLTMGDHIWDRPDILEYLDKKKGVLRPANFPEGVPGRGWDIFETPSGMKVGVVNLLGRVFMRYQVDCPFRILKSIAEEIRQQTKVIVVDMHAETTSEKNAIGLFADGMVSAVVGTHTHIQTADEKVLPKGTAYITDLGMTGPYDSVIGQNKEKIIQRFLTSMATRFEVAKGDPRLHGAVIRIDDATGSALSIERIQRSL